MARLIAFLYLLPLGFVDLRAMAQETAAQSRLGKAMESAALVAGQEKEANPGTAFKECDRGCPVMIVIPAGKFMLGSPENESERRSNEGPQHEVTIAWPFAVSKFEVTFEEWDACAAAAASVRNRPRSSAEAHSPRRIILSATIRGRLTCRAL